MDEAGRGPLAGPVVAAAVILRPGAILQGVDDSKRLSPRLREALFEVVRREALAWGVGLADEEEIARLNILWASQRAMLRAIAALDPPPDLLLVDGLPLREASLPQRALVRGDSRSLSIAAASIIAKVSRDRIMEEMDRRYPGYGFARHKGYGTAEHWAALRSLGLSPIHRRSFPALERLACLKIPGI